MRTDIGATEFDVHLFKEVFNLAAFLRIASELGTNATGTNRVLVIVQFANRSALGLESFNIRIISGNSMAIMLLHAGNSLNSVARNNSLTIELSLGATTIR